MVTKRLRDFVIDAVRWLDRVIEPYLMVFFYVALALIISIEVARRYLTGEQTQWGSVVSIYCFIWLSWLGCSYHVKQRTHLRFGEVRRRLPRRMKAACYVLDDVLWLLFAWVAVEASIDLIQTQNRLQNVIEGTQSVPLALATAAVPVGWILISIRALQDMVKIVMDVKAGREFERDIVAVD